MSIEIHKLLLFVFWIHLHSHDGFSQESFIRLLDLEKSSLSDIDDIVFHDDKLFINGNIVSDTFPSMGEYFYVMDSMGNKVSESYLFDTIKKDHFIKNPPSRLIPYHDSILLVPYYVELRNTFGLFALNIGNHDINAYEYSNNESVIFPGSVVLLQDAIYLTGMIARTNYFLDIYVIKLDGQFNLKWKKYYGTYPHHEVFGGVQISGDSAITISSNRLNDDYADTPVGQQGWVRPWVFTIDNSGAITEEWLGAELDPKTLGGGPFVYTGSGDICMLSNDYIPDTIDNFEYIATVPYISLLDSAFNLKWKLSLSDTAGAFTDLTDIEFLPITNEILVAGLKTVVFDNDYTQLVPWVIKLDLAGSMIWEYADSIKIDGSELRRCSTVGIDVSPSGSIYVAGNIISLTANKSLGWVMKLSSEGCLEAGCHAVSSSDAEPGSEQTNKEEGVILTPNLVSNELIIHNTQSNGLLKGQMYNLYGVALQEIILLPGENSFELDLPSGHYFIIFRSTNDDAMVKKFVVTH